MSRLTRRACVAVFATVCAVSLSAVTHAGKFNRQLSVGDAAPAWGELKTVDGRAVNLDDFRASRAVVLMFFSNRCPVSQAYTLRLNGMAADFADQNVALVAVSVSHAAADDFEAMQIRARQQKFRFDYAQDLSQEIARRYGARFTPQVFVLNGERKIAYMGGIDDSPKSADDVREAYLRDAVAAVLRGEAPEIGETRPVGCEIEFVARE